MNLAETAPFVRGQILFFQDNAAVVVDAQNAVHVDAMGVARAPIAALIATHGPIVRRRQP